MKLSARFTNNFFFIFLFLLYFFLLSSLALLITPLFLPQVHLLSFSFEPVGLGSVLAVAIVAYLFSRMHAGVSEHGGHDCIESLLENKVTRFVTELRQPLTDIKQIAYFSPHMDDAEEGRRRIIAASEEALDMVKRFELESTGRTLVEPASHIAGVVAES